MRRRDFITLLGGAAAAWPLAARAQQNSAKLPTIGYLGTATPAAWSQWTAAFLQRLHELGWLEGRTLVVEYRWAEGRTERFAEIAAEFVRRKVDIIVTSGAALAAARAATSTIPIVFAAANDPLNGGFVASLARPGGNVTGLSTQAPELGGKRLGLLREMIPDLHRLGIMANVGYAASVTEMSEAQAAARSLGLEVVPIEVRRAEDVAPVLQGLGRRADTLYVVFDPLVNANRTQITSLALADRLPVISGVREIADAGGLMSYGASFPALFRRAADYVDKILRGTKPADIPVEQPTKFDLIINLTTARILGLKTPPTLLALADEVIE
jgi:putative ABC transport system substrate-binding protein